MLDKILYEEEVRGLTCSAGLFRVVVGSRKHREARSWQRLPPLYLCDGWLAYEQLLRLSQVQPDLA